ncbi:hypothetical protein HQ520_04190 [bacterium]|nr:hypothetical protein [bacterium]
MFDLSHAKEPEKKHWLEADRYSFSEMAVLADQKAFHRRRMQIRATNIRRALRRMFRRDSGFSAAELAHVLRETDDPSGWAADLLAEAHWYEGQESNGGDLEPLTLSRILHSLGTAILELAGKTQTPLSALFPGLHENLSDADSAWLEGLGLSTDDSLAASDWAERARDTAFQNLHHTVLRLEASRMKPPHSALRSDEIVWGRAPARLDLGGGWSDTPPYTLEFGGSVINAAVNLNGQPPIQAYARVIREPVIRVGSIDFGGRIEISTLDQLHSYHEVTSEFSLAKAAFVLCGLSPRTADWPRDASLQDILQGFGGGLELTTLAAIPGGSGLGTSSILGAVILAVIQRVMGRVLPAQELFHGVLRLEQALATGGGWQDQIGGAVDGVKVIHTDAGLIPQASIHYVPGDVLDPVLNDGRTLLYYTGITRLAKNILQQVVGRYLDRNRSSIATLRQIHASPPRVADAMSRKDYESFGGMIQEAWDLKKQLDPGSTNDRIETLLDRMRPHVLGTKLLGAGGGGFVLVLAKTVEDARILRKKLEAEPPNERARFFDYSISREGLVVTVC